MRALRLVHGRPDTAGEPAGETAQPASLESDTDLFVSRQAQGGNQRERTEQATKASVRHPKDPAPADSSRIRRSSRPPGLSIRRRVAEARSHASCRRLARFRQSPIRRSNDAGSGAARASRKPVRMSQRSARKAASRATGRTGDRTWCVRRPPQVPDESSRLAMASGPDPKIDAMERPYLNDGSSALPRTVIIFTLGREDVYNKSKRRLKKL